LSGRNSAVECQLPKLDVAGSTPVARSKVPVISPDLSYARGAGALETRAPSAVLSEQRSISRDCALSARTIACIQTFIKRKHRKEVRPMTLKIRSLAVAALAVGLMLSGGIAHAQPTTLPPPRTHAGPTAMSMKAEKLQHDVAAEIAAAKAKGQDVTVAEKHQDEGDAALKTGHLRIAVAHYEAAEKALK
jgi:hypothetical protein